MIPVPALLRWIAAPTLLLLASAAQAAITPEDGARFLIQSSFGPSDDDLARVRTLGFAGWINEQMGKSPTLHRPAMTVQPILGLGLPIDLVGEAESRQEAWWRIAVNADDQLRQRVAFALSEILVVSDQLDTLDLRPLLSAEYYDILVRNAFGNYRTLLGEVSHSPAMGLYLSFMRNNRGNADGSRRPDENYAREVMQLFSIGLWQLNVDGTPKLDGSGQRIATYDQTTIADMSRVLTGWTWGDVNDWQADGESYGPLQAFEDHHDDGAKIIIGDVSLPAGQTAAQDLEATLDALFAQPNVGPFLARRLIQRLVTSSPSPAYVGRVARVFNDNGSGVRGDLAAVVRAILLDTEARSAPAERVAKLREPMLRVTALWRAFGATSRSGHYVYSNAERELGQAPLRARSVFNFFMPDYRPPGEIQARDWYAPEFQIENEAQALAIVNALARHCRRYRGAVGLGDDEVAIDLTREKAMTPATLVDRLKLLLLAGRMSDSMRQRLLDYLGSVPDGTQRASDAILLVVTSPEFAVQR